MKRRGRAWTSIAKLFFRNLALSAPDPTAGHHPAAVGPVLQVLPHPPSPTPGHSYPEALISQLEGPWPSDLRSTVPNPNPNPVALRHNALGLVDQGLDLPVSADLLHLLDVLSIPQLLK